MVLFNLVNLQYKERYHKSIHRIGNSFDDDPRSTKCLFRTSGQTKATNLVYGTIQRYSYNYVDQESLFLIMKITKTLCKRYLI